MKYILSYGNTKTIIEFSFRYSHKFCFWGNANAEVSKVTIYDIKINPFLLYYITEGLISFN